MQQLSHPTSGFATAFVCLLACSAVGCTPFVGSPSVAIISMTPAHSVYEPVGEPIEESACSWAALLVAGGDVSTHEAIIDRALERSGADILLNAELENWQLFLYLFQRNCVTVRGQPARLLRETGS